MLTTKDKYDVAVVGCGPAGSVVCRELIRLGHRVLLIAGERKFAGFEGLSERAWNGLQFAGCDNALSVTGLEVRRSARWNGEEFEGNRERVVDRRRLDVALLQDAVDAGAGVIRARARSVERSQSGWRIRFGLRSDLPPAEAKFLIDARGRSARRNKSTWVSGPATMSLGRRYMPKCPDVAMTRLTTFESGWAWWAADGTGTVVVQIIRSIEEESLPPRYQLEEYFESLLVGVNGIESLVDLGKPVSAIHGRDAGTAMCTAPVSRDHARVGDAAFSIDPLSGHGIFEAVSGALVLAPVVNTLLRQPDDAGVAMQFYRDKLSVDFWRMARTGRDFYRMEQRWPTRPFWRERQEWPDDQPSHDTPGAARVESRAVSDEGLIRIRNVVVTGDHPRGIWRMAGVSLVDLLDFMSGRKDRESHAAVDAAAQHFETTHESIETATGWLRFRGLFE